MEEGNTIIYLKKRNKNQKNIKNKYREAKNLNLINKIVF